MIVVDIDGVGWSPRMGCSILKILRNFDFCKPLSFHAHIDNQSLNGSMVHGKSTIY